MADAYVYRGEPRDYHTVGHVKDGDVAYFDRPPDSRWRPYTGNAAPTVDATEQAPRQPNKAASAADWQAYAEQHGGFQDATGTIPADATRKAIVDHYTAPEPGADGQDAAPAAETQE